ncbi:MAG: DUF4175 family protein [Deferrisomatales bacterium]
MTGREALLALLGRTRRRSLGLGLGRGLAAGLLGLGAAALAGSAAAAWLPEGLGPWAVALGLGVGVVAGAWLARAEWRRARPRLSAPAAAARLAGGDPALADRVATGADLAGWGEAGAGPRGASPALAEAEVAAAAALAQALDPVRALPWGPLVRRLGQAGAVALVLAGWLAWGPATARDAWVRLAAGPAPRPVAVGNLRLALAPPAYTGLPEAEVQGTDGAVEALAGTRVTLSGEVSRAVDGGVWEGPGGVTVPLAVEGRVFTVSWILDQAGTYTLGFERRGRPVPTDLGPRPVTLVEDARPRAEMAEPAADLEVGTDQAVTVRFEASDDFRVERVELVLQGDAEVRIAVPVTPGGRVEGVTRFLPLAHPTLGDGAHLRVEAWDGDAVAGPKAGSSRSVYLTFLSKQRLMAEIEGLEERLLEALLAQLADHLEAPEPPPPPALERLRTGGKDLLALVAQLVDRVRRGADEGAVGALAVLRIEEGLRAALEPFLAGATPRDGVVAELERDALFLDRLLQSLRMEQALAQGDELAALQRSLFDDLQAGVSPQELVSRLDRLRELLARMAERMARASAEMPDAFANADAVRDMPASELQQLMERLRQALEAGDREAAQALAEELLATLSRWLAALEEAAGAAGQGQVDPALRELAELEAEVREVAGRQEGVLDETRQVGQEASRRAAERLRAELESFLQRQERRLRAVEDAARSLETLAPPTGFHGAPPGFLPPGGAPPDARAFLEARQRLAGAAAEVREGLAQDLGRARQGAEELGAAVEALRRALAPAAEGSRRPEFERQAQLGRQEAEAIRADLERLAGRRLEGLTPEERSRLAGLGRREEELAERAGRLAERLEALARETPLLGPGAAERARGAGGAMGEAGGRLGQGDPFAAVPPETRALEELAEVSRQLQGARQQLEQGGGAGGFQVVRRPGQGPGHGPGGRDVDRGPVEIPREAEARELKAFREEVLKAMRTGRYPKDYEEEVERYYERLIR